MAQTQDKPLNELLSRDLVDIYVGQENTHWILHEKLLCYRSKFFRNVFYGKEKNTHKFSLPDDEDEAFRLFVGWLYSGAVPSPKEEKDLTNLFELYLMSEKWDITTLMQESLQAVRNFYKDTDSYPALRRVQYIYGNTDQDSPMRQLLIGSVARMFVLGDGMAPQWDKALRKNGQLAVDIMLVMQKWGLDKDAIPDPRQDSVVPIMEEAMKAREQNNDDEDEAEGSEEEQNDEEEDNEEGAKEEQNDDEEDNEEGEQEENDDEEGEQEENDEEQEGGGQEVENEEGAQQAQPEADKQ